MNGERVNKVTTKFEDAGVVITLYRTHKNLGTLTNEQLGIPNFEESKAANKSAYAQYCRETAINLLENGGIEGYYYDAQNRAEGADRPKKFDTATFKEWAVKIVEEKITSMDLGDVISVVRVNPNADVTATERYADGNIKYGTAQATIEVHAGDQSRVITASAELKSGQLCKPKSFKYGATEYNLNPTNIRKLFGPADTKTEDKPKTAEKKAQPPKNAPVVDTPVTEPVNVTGSSDDAISKLMSAIREGE